MQAFADYVRQLRNAGSDVIVDDIGFGSESFFQPSVIDRAIADVVKDGAVYLSSAANNAANGYEAPTNLVRIGRDLFVDFDPGPRVDTRLRVSVPGNTPVTLQWDNPYDGIVGTATSDLDLIAFSTRYPDTQVGALDTNNLKTGLPIEIGTASGTADIAIRVADHLNGAPLPTRFKIVFATNGAGDVTTEFPTNQRSVAGHNGGENTISVGAVPFFAPGNNEDFSSVGPVTRLFDVNGNRLPALVTLQKPDVSGIDNANTSFFPIGTGTDIDQDPDALPNFGGTSAAAPNVAAVVALIRQADPTATADQIAQVLRDTAVPINGASAGAWDPKGGFGLIDALAATAFFVKAPIGDIKDVTPDPTVQTIDTLRITFTQRVSGLSIDDLTLSRDGGTNLLSGAQRLSTIDNGRTYILRDLASLTDLPGTYTLRIRAAGSGIVNDINLPLANDIVETWTKLIEQPIPTRPSDVATQVLSSTTVRITWDDNSNNEDGFIIQRADDPDFTVNVKNFAVGANRVAFTDHVPVPSGKHFFYRVRAFNDFSGPSVFSPAAEAFTPTVGEVVMNIGSSRGIALTGSWADDEGPSISDGNTGKGAKSVRFTPALQFTDEYFVYAKWVGGSDRATNVPFDIFFGRGGTDRHTVIVDERARSGGYVLLGKFRMEKGTNAGVRVRNFGTNGVVNIQSIRFLPANGRD
jgi:hypothetical protein